MGLERISDAVLNAARTEAEHILVAARHAAGEKLSAARLSAEREAERGYLAAIRAIEENAARQLIQAHGAAGKILLSKKNECLDRIFDAAVRAIRELPANEYAAILRTLLERAAEGHAGLVRVHADDAPLFDGLLRDMNRQRSTEIRLALDDTHPLPERGGFIFAAQDFYVDQTLQSILSEVRRELAPAIAADLFGA